MLFFLFFVVVCGGVYASKKKLISASWLGVCSTTWTLNRERQKREEEVVKDHSFNFKTKNSSKQIKNKNEEKKAEKKKNKERKPLV